ncbi:MAG: hypothetical protein RBS01_00370, partial [Candidatus Dojkabacteria bacterium]|nr:hypothetical protein [Candidatus Dojkabacteria bacterium]
METDIKQTPMMDQYLRFKKQYPDKVVLFRMGDFFETFGEDAKITSKVLNITLTARDKSNNPTPLAGFPHKALDQYLPKLVRGGYCVVIVDQLEDPKLAKGIVKRGVTRIVTPGTLDSEDSVKSNYICSFCKIKNDLGISLCDISTGELIWIQSKYLPKNIESVISSFDPSEILLLESEKEITFSTLPVQFLGKGLQNIKYSEEVIKEFFEISNMESLGLESKEASICAVSMILKHIQETQLMEPKHIKKPKRRNLNSNMILDRATIRNLELVSSSYSNDIHNSLFSIIDFTSTQMGKRLLYSWILNPLIEKKGIEERLNMIEIFLSDREVLSSTREILAQVSDIERIVGKIGLGRANGRDLKGLQISLEQISKLRKVLSPIPQLVKILDEYHTLLVDLPNEIDECIVDSPPTSLTEGSIIKSSYNEKVKELRELSGDSKSWI